MNAEPSELTHLRRESARLRFLLRFYSLTVGGDGEAEMIRFIDQCLDRGESPADAAAIAQAGAAIAQRRREHRQHRHQDR
jgi:hypothetical protein